MEVTLRTIHPLINPVVTTYAATDIMGILVAAGAAIVVIDIVAGLSMKLKTTS